MGKRETMIVTVSVRQHKVTGRFAAFLDVNGDLKRTDTFATHQEAEQAANEMVRDLQAFAANNDGQVLFSGWIGEKDEADG